MKTMLSWLYFITLIAAGGVGLVALFNWIENKHFPLWAGPIFMAVVAAMTSASRYADSKGWITYGFLSKAQQATKRDIEARKQELAAQREAIIAEAKAKI